MSGGGGSGPRARAASTSSWKARARSGGIAPLQIASMRFRRSPSSARCSRSRLECLVIRSASLRDDGTGRWSATRRCIGDRSPAVTLARPAGTWRGCEAPNHDAFTRFRQWSRSAPVWRDPTGRTGGGLVDRMVVGRSQPRSIERALRHEVPEPVLAGLEALRDAVARLVGVPAGMLGRRRVTAADMATGRAASEVEPPAAARGAFDAARPARCARSGRCRVEPPRSTS